MEFEKLMVKLAKGVPADTLLKQATLIRDDSVKRVPIASGKLKGSVRISQRADEVTVAYAAPYALVVHEDLQARHPVGTAKYLELAVHAMAPTILNNIAAEVLK